jgi:protein-L-isoaspartate(D-aspartate) O-methyltransferase
VAGQDAESRGLRRALVDTLRRADRLHSARVAQAMLDVPREFFVADIPLEHVYRPAEAIVTKRVDGVSVSSASAPEVVALMLEQLDPRPGDRVLEIGAGTGYNAALLQHLVGESGQVVTLDIDDDLVLSARAHLRQAGYEQVEVFHADGALGYPSARPFDRIMLTVASADIAPAWREQLATPHGCLVLPLALNGPQRSIAFRPAGNHFQSTSIRNCSFIPLRGLLAAGSTRLALDPEGSLVLVGSVDPPPLPVETIAALLQGSMRSRRSGVDAGLDELREGLHLWLAAHQPGLCTLWGGTAQLVPDLFGLGERTGTRGTLCVVDTTGVVLLAWTDETRRGGDLLLLAPPRAKALVDQVRGVLTAWVSRGRPNDQQLTVRAYPRGVMHQPHERGSDQVTIEQRWSSFDLSWASPLI